MGRQQHLPRLRREPNNSSGVAPEHRGRRGQAWQARLRRSLGDNTQCAPVGGSRDGSGYDLGTAYLILPDGLAVQG